MTDRRLSLALAGVLLLGACSSGAPTQAARKTVPFKEARLIVEINATDGDAGFQVFLDHEPWKAISISRPDGSKIVDIQTEGVLADYGLTELFWESSEPPFTRFPLERFTQLFPAGEYTFEGETIDGVSMRSAVTLTHDFPAGPEILSPEEDATLPGDDLLVRWEPVTKPAGIEIAGHQVIVTREDEPVREFSVDLPATATRLLVPSGILEPGAKEYKIEVLAIEASGNQTSSEIPFSTE